MDMKIYEVKNGMKAKLKGTTWPKNRGENIKRIEGLPQWKPA